MKRYLFVAVLIVTAAVLMVACNRQPQTAGQAVIFADTTGLAEFQQWKAMNERLDPNMYYNQPAVAPSVPWLVKQVHAEATIQVR